MAQKKVPAGLLTLLICLFMSLIAAITLAFLPKKPASSSPTAEPTVSPCREHAFSAWEVTLPATVFDKGEETRVCSVCGFAETRETDVLPYDFDAVDYAALEKALDNVPSSLKKLCTPESLATLDKVKEDIRSRYGKMTQEMADDCIDEFYDAVASLDYPRGDTPRIYIFAPEKLTKKEFRNGVFLVVDKEGGSEKSICEPDGLIRLRGNTTGETYNKKLPYNIKFSRKVKFLGMGKAKKWALLANSFDKSLIRNAVAVEFADRLNLDYSSDYRYVELYYNGEYHGSYMVIENVDVSSSRVDIDLDRGDYLVELEKSRVKTGVTYYKTPNRVRFAIEEPETPTDAQLAAIKASLDEIDEALKSGDEARIRALVDVDSFLDFYLHGELLKNVDVGFSSTFFYRKDGLLYAGPVWDFDISAGNVHYTYYPEYNNLETSGDPLEGLWVSTQMKWFGFLCDTDWFPALVKARYKEIQPIIENLYRDNELGRSVIDTLLDRYGASFERNFTESPYTIYTDIRLGRLHGKTFQSNLDYLRTWIEDRNEWLLKKWKIQ